MVIIEGLHRYSNHEFFKPEMLQFFSTNHNLLLDIIETVSDGNFKKKLEKKIINEMEVPKLQDLLSKQPNKLDVVVNGLANGNFVKKLVAKTVNKMAVTEMMDLFSNQHKKLNEVVRNVNGGNFMTKLVRDIFSEVQEQYSDPDRGIKLIIDLGLPVRRYRLMAAFNQFHNKTTQTWDTKKLYGVPIPQTWPSNEKVMARWIQLRDSFSIKSITGLGFYASYWRVDKWLEYILDSPFYSSFITDKQNLEIIVRGDGFKAGKQPCTFLLVTLGNFGILSKCVVFNFMINFAMKGEKDGEELRRAFE